MGRCFSVWYIDEKIERKSAAAEADDDVKRLLATINDMVNEEMGTDNIPKYIPPSGLMNQGRNWVKTEN